MRNKLFIAAVVISFVSVAVFGFTAIGSDGCIASIASGHTCPVRSNVSMIEFYLASFKGFSTTTIFQLALLFVLLAVAVVGSIALQQLSFVVVRTSRSQQAAVGFSLPLQRKFQRWLRQRQSTEAGFSF